MFQDRIQAGEFLAARLTRFCKNPNIVVIALPRGGVPVADVIADFLDTPLDLVITRKIGHPYSHEYALGALSEYGSCVLDTASIKDIDPEWIDNALRVEQKEIDRRKKIYLGNRKRIALKDKIVILVDDGVATGMTILAALKDIRTKYPQKIIIAIPIIPESAMKKLTPLASESIALQIPKDEEFLGAVGAYYPDFTQVSDASVTSLLKKHQKET